MALLVMAASVPVQAKTPEAQVLSAQLDAYFTRQTAAGLFSGSVLIARDQAILFDTAYGLADREFGVPNTPQTRYLLASVSKQFIAMSVLLLQQQQKLTVQDHVCQYVPDCPRAWNAITLHHLLTHTSGIPDYMAFDDFVTQMGQPYSSTQLVGWFRNKPLEFVPGTRWRYSNSGYALLGYIIEQVSGEPLTQFLSESIFTPLQMADSGYDPDNTTWSGMARGYEGDAPSDYMDMSVAFAPGGLYASTEDLWRWSTAMDAGTLIDGNIGKLLFQPYVRIPGVHTGYYGYGWYVRKRVGHNVLEHTGTLAGFTTIITRFPNEHVTMIILSNQDVNINVIANTVTRYVFNSR
ncbi:MAG TPA: serine hydrolase domain-containing protein [Anaerolineae bacterium]